MYFVGVYISMYHPSYAYAIIAAATAVVVNIHKGREGVLYKLSMVY